MKYSLLITIDLMIVADDMPSAVEQVKQIVAKIKENPYTRDVDITESFNPDSNRNIFISEEDPHGR